MRFKNTMTSEGAHACLSDRLLIIQYPFENYHSRSSLLPDFIFGTYHLMPGYITNTTMRAIGGCCFPYCILPLFRIGQP